MLKSTDISTLGLLSGSVQGKSAFQAASNEQVIVPGTINHLLTSLVLDPQKVEEGGKKPAGGADNRIQLTADKYAYIYVSTEEAIEQLGEGNLDNKLSEGAVNYFAKKFDVDVAAGVLGNTEDVDELEVTDWTSFKAGVNASPQASAIVMSTAFWNSISDYTNAQGNYFIPQVGGGLTDLFDLPVIKYRSTEPVAFVGDFEGASAYGVAVPSSGMVRKAKDGIVVDTNGVEHNLTQENKVAHIIEAYYGFAVEPTQFRKLTLGEEV